MDKAIKDADFRKGDEVLIRTGWGTRARAYDSGSTTTRELRASILTRPRSWRRKWTRWGAAFL